MCGAGEFQKGGHTSSPRMNTSESFSISSSRAEFRASRTVSCSTQVGHRGLERGRPDIQRIILVKVSMPRATKENAPSEMRSCDCIVRQRWWPAHKDELVSSIGCVTVQQSNRNLCVTYRHSPQAPQPDPDKRLHYERAQSMIRIS